MADYKLPDQGAQAQLEAHDLYAEPSGPGWVRVRDAEGGYVLHLPEGVGENELRQILAYGARCLQRGSEAGRDLLRRELLGLIGAQPSS